MLSLVNGKQKRSSWLHNPSCHCVGKMEEWVHVSVGKKAPFFTFGPLPSIWSTNQSLIDRSLVSYLWEQSSSSSLFINLDLLHMFSTSRENANTQDCLQWRSSTQTIIELGVWLLSQIILVAQWTPTMHVRCYNISKITNILFESQ